MLRNQNILIISPQRWDDIYVSKHHYAIELGRRFNLVYFLNPPSDKYRISKTVFTNVFSLDYPGHLPGLRFLPRVLQRLLMKHVAQRLEGLSGLNFNIVWSFDNSVFFDLDAFGPDTLKICHIVDLNQDFQFVTAAITADLCISTNRFVLEKFKQVNSRSYFINHGFSERLEKTPAKVRLPGANRIKVGYAGNLDIPYIDWALLNTILDQNPHIDVVIAGPWKNQSLDGVRLRNNLFYIGVLTAEELPSFYSEVDALILFYLADTFRWQLANPHKMMEYLGSGKMICSTFTVEYAEMAKTGLFAMSETNAEFPELFRRSMASLDLWNSESLRSKRKSFAQLNTYEQQVDRIEGLINGLIKEGVSINRARDMRNAG